MGQPPGGRPLPHPGRAASAASRSMRGTGRHAGPSLAAALRRRHHEPSAPSPERAPATPVPTRKSNVARKKTPTALVNVKARLSARLLEVRRELFGEHGGPELARRLGMPARTWYNYETGVTVPAEILLSFIDQTGTNPVWLLNGEGPK